MSLIHPIRTAIAAVFVATSVAACQQTGASSAAAAERMHPEYDTATGKLKRLQWDSKGDGKIDTWGYMDGTQVVRIEVDEDGDGKVDRWEYYRADAEGRGGPTGPGKTLERIEQATRHDGTVSRWEYFDDNGSPARIEEDTDGDGKVDKWETYKDGALSMMALDTQGHGKPDRRLIYLPDGTLDRIETDPTGSGQFSRLPQ